MNILFMGTPEFASSVLRTLAHSRHEVICAICQPDKPCGRGHKLTPPPVKVTAAELGIPVLQPEKLKKAVFYETLQSLNPDVIAVAAYGKILHEYVLNYPRYGCVCVHGSILPEYRGAAPIQRAIMDGKSRIGISIMKMDKGIDTGAVYQSRGLDFTDENAGQITSALADLGGEMLLQTLDGLENGTAQAVPQSETGSSYAEKLTDADRALDFSLPAVRLHNTVRALAPADPAICSLDSRPLKITQAALSDAHANGAPGSINSLNSRGAGGIAVNCGDGVLIITRLIPQGKKEMSAGDFIRGRQINEEMKFEKL